MTKKLFILSFFIILCTAWLCPDEAVLIDFSLLVADVRIPISENDQGTDPNENSHTLITFGSSSDPSTRRLLQTSLAIANFAVSRRYDMNSHVREAPSRQWGTVMGALIGRRDSLAYIRPPFVIPLDDPRFENAYGLVRRDRGIRLYHLAINVYALNYPPEVSLSVILLDGTGNQHIFPIPTLSFEGWRELTSRNPNYEEEVLNDTGYYDSLRFGGFLVEKDLGTDVILYFKDIKLIFDLEP